LIKTAEFKDPTHMQPAEVYQTEVD